MPLDGTLDVSERADGAPTLDGFSTPALELPGVSILHVLFELPGDAVVATVPPALHPTNPPSAAVVCWSVPTSPWGPFRLALCRVGARAGAKLRGYVTGCFVDNPEAGEALDRGWGYGCTVAEVATEHRHDLVAARVEHRGRTVLDAALLDPEPIAGSDVFFTAGMHLAHTPSGLRLVQVDPEYVFHRADRGRPDLRALDGAAFGDDAIRCAWPISGSATMADVTLPELRYVCRPEVSARRGTERVS